MFLLADAAFYQYEGERPVRLTDYLADDIRDVAALLARGGYKYNRAFFLGDGAEAYREIILRNVPGALIAPPLMNRQRASSTGAAALHMIEDGFEPPASGEFELLYVRKPQAVREREAGKASSV